MDQSEKCGYVPCFSLWEVSGSLRPQRRFCVTDPDPDIAAGVVSPFFVGQVDREERPDVDQCFMNFVQATTGGGGWPMSVWLTPELKPFTGATYFPEERFISVLNLVADKWSSDRCTCAFVFRVLCLCFVSPRLSRPLRNMWCVCLSTCLPACLPACPPARLPVCLSYFPFACVFICLPSCLPPSRLSICGS